MVKVIKSVNCSMKISNTKIHLKQFNRTQQENKENRGQITACTNNSHSKTKNLFEDFNKGTNKK